MPLFCREDLERLMAPHSAPCVSLFMPTHRHHPGTEQDRVRFKNLLREAETLLGEGRKAKDLRDLLDPVAAFSEPSFWRYQKDGLAVFRSADFTAHFRVPTAVPELVVVADTFHVKPLVRFLQDHRRFYVLALAQKSVQLYEGTPESLAAVHVDDLPASLAEALGVAHEAGFLNLRTLRPGQAGVFHGQGGAEEAKKDDLVRFFREIDRTLWRILRDESVPLVLAGVGYSLPLYREVNRYRRLLDAAVEGSVEGVPPEDLHARVWPIVRAAFDEEAEAVLAFRAEAAGRGLVRDDLATIARMAVHGRVRRLFLADGAHAWGRLDRDTGDVALSPKQQDARDDDVLDDLAESVLLRGGDLLTVPAERLAPDAVASAVLRW